MAQGNDGISRRLTEYGKSLGYAERQKRVRLQDGQVLHTERLKAAVMPVSLLASYGRGP